MKIEILNMILPNEMYCNIIVLYWFRINVSKLETKLENLDWRCVIDQEIVHMLFCDWNVLQQNIRHVIGLSQVIEMLSAVAVTA